MSLQKRLFCGKGGVLFLLLSFTDALCRERSTICPYKSDSFVGREEFYSCSCVLVQRELDKRLTLISNFRQPDAAGSLPGALPQTPEFS